MPYLVSIREDGRCAACASEDVIVLARALQAGHDHEFRRSRQLARTFCELVMNSAATSRLGRQELVGLGDRLFSMETWSGWHLSFCAVELKDGLLRAFGCGLCGIVVRSNDGTVHELVRHQTLGRKLRAEGITDVPWHAEYVGVPMLGKGTPASDIQEADLEIADVAITIANAQPELQESLPELVASETSLEEIRNAIERYFDSVHNPTRAFVLWSRTGS